VRHKRDFCIHSASSALPCAIDSALAGAKPDSVALAAAVRSRFGRETFTAGARTALNRLLEAT
jgi:hypothetical protein